MKEFNKLKQLLLELEEDATKFYTKGNKSAGLRVRIGMKELKKQAELVRKTIPSKNSKKI